MRRRGKRAGIQVWGFDLGRLENYEKGKSFEPHSFAGCFVVDAGRRYSMDSE